MREATMNANSPTAKATTIMTSLKLAAAGFFFWSALSKVLSNSATTDSSMTVLSAKDEHRRLLAVGDDIPSYMKNLMNELHNRKKLFEDTPPEEVKYWFEYTGPLQVCF